MNKATLTALAILSIAGCSGGSPNGGPIDAGSAEPDATGPDSLARNLVAEKTGVAAEGLKILSVEAVEFPDSSLGCPLPDMAYLPVITPGHKVMVETPDGKTLDVRIAGTQGKICEAPSAVIPKR